MRLYKNCNILNRNFSPKKVSLLVDHGKIKEIFPHSIERLENCEEIDLEEALIVPGLTDIHVHGAQGISFANKKPEEILEAYKAQKKNGTHFLIATLVTLPFKKLKEALRSIKEAQKEEPNILGAYIEGPFINPKKSGGMRKDYILSWEIKDFIQIIEEFSNVIKIVTVAPERTEVLKVTEILHKNDVKIALGHSEASYEECKAFEEKVSLFTHLFNAMGSFHHRKPGIVGFALEGEKFCEIIPEKHHLHKAAIAMAFKAKGKDKIIPISDGTPLSATEKKEDIFSGKKVTKVNGAVFTEDKKLFGSCITLIEGLKYLTTLGIYRDLKEAVIYNLKNTYNLLKHNVWIEKGLSFPLMAIYSDSWRLLTR